MRTEELLGSTGRLDDLDETGSESLDGGNVVGEDTHVTRSSGDVTGSHRSQRGPVVSASLAAGVGRLSAV